MPIPLPYTSDGKRICRRCGKASPPTVEFFETNHSASDGCKSACRKCTGVPWQGSKFKIPAPQAVSAHTKGENGEVPEFDITVVEPALTQQDVSRDKLEIARLKQKIQALEAHAKELEREHLADDKLRELLGSLGAPNITPDPDWLRGPRVKRSVTGTAHIIISDIHADEVVNPAEIGGVNEYNREICLRRLRNTWQSGIVLLKDFMAAPKYEGAVMALLGDIVSGNIHEELEITNEAPILETCQVMEGALIEAVGNWADEFGKLHVPCVVGNHGRLHKKPRAKRRARDNYEWLIYQRLASYFRNDARITFDIPDGPDVFWHVYDKVYNGNHGDAFRGGDGVGGILVPIMRGLSRKQFKQTAMGRPFDRMVIGHWHQLIMLHNLVVNGSIKGFDEYANSQNFAFTPPQQALFVEHPEVGPSASWPILCAYEGGKLQGKRLKT